MTPDHPTASSAAAPCADVLALLAQGHDRTRALADECRRLSRHVSPRHDMRPLAERLCDAVRRMAALEEEVVYPAARDELPESALALARLEHATAREIIRRMQALDPGEPCYEALVIALTDCVDRHVRLEQAELFPRLRAAVARTGTPIA